MVGSVGFGRIRSDLVGFGRIRSDLVGFGRIRSDLVGFGWIWSERSDLVGFGRSSFWEGTGTSMTLVAHHKDVRGNPVTRGDLES